MSKSIVFIFNEMSIGGSTTSLLSILQRLDQKKFNIELLLLRGKGVLIESVPEYIQVLPHVFSQKVKRKTIVKRAVLKLSGRLVGRMIEKNEAARQIMDWENVRISKTIEKEYDIAVAFEEGFPTYYMVKKVRSKKKIAWIHTDYKEAGFWDKMDRGAYSVIDKIVLVSPASKKSFDGVFPEYKNKTLVIENLLPTNIIIERAKEEILFETDKTVINLITVCRIDFTSKGLDRGIAAFANLKKENSEIGMKWYIIGTGPDSGKLERMIKRNELEKDIELLGEMKNPLPFVKDMDIFLLPSRFEGKPMAITEAQILGIPPVVTEYASANDQINSGLDGLVVENNEKTIEEALRHILKHPEKISFWKDNLKKRNFENVNEFQKIIRLFEKV